MACDTDDDWEIVARRMARVPDALASVEAALREGMARGIVAARRQALGVRGAGRDLGRRDAAPFFRNARRHAGPTMHARSRDAAEAATGAYARARRVPPRRVRARRRPARPGRRASATRCSRASSTASSSTSTRRTRGAGTSCTASSTRCARSRERILPGATVDAVIEHLEPTRRARSRASTSSGGGTRTCIDRTIAELERHALRHPRAGAAVRGDDRAAGRRGRDVLHGPERGLLAARAARGTRRSARRRFPLWGEVSICYHEGVPGHHLQVAQVRYLADELSRVPAHACGFVSGHGEGWALYAERLMGELGYLDDPAYELGHARARRRCARCASSSTSACTSSSPIPDRRALPPGRDVDARARAAVRHRAQPSSPTTSWRSEVDRYLGWPGQAISYKVGERVWLEARADAAAAPRRRLRPEGVPPLRARPRRHGPRPAARRARPLLVALGRHGRRLRSTDSNETEFTHDGVTQHRVPRRARARASS